jgi:PKD repeat protein
MVAGFTADETDICEGGQVQFTDESTGNPSSWEWTFEGGTPATSTEQNPVVTYEIPGGYDVTLTVASGSANNTITSPDIITVNPLPDVSLMSLTACEYWEPFFLEGGMPEGGEYSGVGVENGMFYPAIAGVGIHVIYYTYQDEVTGCENVAEAEMEVSLCVGIAEHGPAFFRMYPNPSKGELYLEIANQANYNVTITNILGAVVLEQQIAESTMINLNTLESGIYTVTVSDGATSMTRKLTLRK